MRTECGISHCTALNRWCARRTLPGPRLFAITSVKPVGTNSASPNAKALNVNGLIFPTLDKRELHSLPDFKIRSYATKLLWSSRAMYKAELNGR